MRSSSLSFSSLPSFLFAFLSFVQERVLFLRCIRGVRGVYVDCLSGGRSLVLLFKSLACVLQEEKKKKKREEGEDRRAKNERMKEEAIDVYITTKKRRDSCRTKEEALLLLLLFLDVNVPWKASASWGGAAVFTSLLVTAVSNKKYMQHRHTRTKEQKNNKLQI